MRRSLVIAVAAALVAAVLPSARALAAEPGERAPACALAAFDAPAHLREVRFEGEVWLVDFWASWCAPCARVFPFLNELDRELGDRGLHIVAVGLDEIPEEARAFVGRHRPTFELATDAQGACPRSFGLEAMPTSYLIDRDGVVRHVFKGFRPGEAERLREAIEALLPAPGMRAANLQRADAR